MAMLKSEIRAWLHELGEEDTLIAIDDGGLSLVEIGENGFENGNRLEVGGHTPPDADEEER